MNGGPFKIDSEYKSILTKKDLAGRGQVFFNIAD